MRKYYSLVMTLQFLEFCLFVGEVRAVTQVFSPAELLGGLALEDFEDDVFVTGVTFSAASGVTRYNTEPVSGVTASGEWGLTTQVPVQSIAMSFDSARPARSVGMFFGNDDTCCIIGSFDFTAYLDIYGASGLLDTIGVQANMNDYADQFIGFNSSTPVISVLLHYGFGEAQLYHYIDDFQFAAIPEPNGLGLLMSFCALALAFARPNHRYLPACRRA
jgi:hypothetical protein